MNILSEIKKRLVCPNHGCQLDIDETEDSRSRAPWTGNKIHCHEGCSFYIENGIPRFVPPNNYASSFGLQWQRYQKTQLDSYTGVNISRKRLENSLKMPLDELKGKIVLEAGCGAGRFTEILNENCDNLVSMDFSSAVDANIRNCQNKNPYLLLQGDINLSPLPKQFFDIVICLGVIQHTPSPEMTIKSLSDHVKPGGLLVIDHYTDCNRFSPLGRILTLEYPIRAILKRLKPKLSLKATIALTSICDPIRKRTINQRWLDRIASRIFPSACYYNMFPDLDHKIMYEWNELDTCDSLTCYYKHYRSPEQITRHLNDLRFTNISCDDGRKTGGNGVVFRATKLRD